MENYLYQDLYLLEDTHWWHRAKRDLVVSLIQEFKTVTRPKILDIGCGAGKNIETFASLGESWGIDVSAEAIKFCKKRRLVNVKLGSAYKLPFPDNSFDVITLLDVLEHVDEDKALSEIHRVLRPEGILVINVPAFSFLWSRWDVVLHHLRRYSRSSLKSCLKRNQFNVASSSYVFSFLVLPILIVRKIKSLFNKKEYGSDFTINAPLVNTLFLSMCWLEHQLIRFFPMPFGTSVVCVGKKIYRFD
jgi:ubiquinone/menaquinone biosynthesis C-methylase UbiE